MPRSKLLAAVSTPEGAAAAAGMLKLLSVAAALPLEDHWILQTDAAALHKKAVDSKRQADNLKQVLASAQGRMRSTGLVPGRADLRHLPLWASVHAHSHRQLPALLAASPGQACPQLPFPLRPGRSSGVLQDTNTGNLKVFLAYVAAGVYFMAWCCKLEEDTLSAMPRSGELRE